MNASKWAGGALAVAVSSIAVNAGAQETTVTSVTTPGETVTYDVAPAGMIQAPRRAFEISVGAGYTQPWGEVDGRRDISGFAGPGFSPSLELGYRLTPRWSIGIAGQYHESTAHDALANGSHVRGFAANANATYHFNPFHFVDPYLQLGTGYRAMWIQPTGADNNDLVHGFELGRIQLGADYRVSRDIAFGPYIAADLNLFAWQHLQNASTSTALEDKKVNTFLSAGVLGRFDLGGVREPKTTVAVEKRTTYFEASTPAPAATPPVTPPDANIYFEAEIMERCGVNGEKAFFAFDSAELTTAGDATLDTVASCLTTGALKDRGIVVVGRADPRGSEAYNERLGMKRADAVRGYLVSHGVPSSNVDSTSRGKQDAVGTDEATWAFDRRVEVNLKR